jgi:GH24 family phage-related lysozyme (muramidase)
MQLNNGGRYLLTKTDKPKLPLDEAQYLVFTLLQYEVNENMFSALVSFISSVGEPAFRKSKVLSLINLGTEKSLLDAGKYLRTTHTMTRGKVNTKLSRLRKAESKLFLMPVIVANNGGKNDNPAKCTL